MIRDASNKNKNAFEMFLADWQNKNKEGYSKYATRCQPPTPPCGPCKKCSPH
jgi:hypothetical protein